ncbi:hypothetical protein ACFQDL_32785 [Marinobacterium aestuariivivens]|uniref:DUF883 domain-containing protein n=2 Tax=Marinobacterium aestuariivivens TaxID=1698799 RepID=A0ABW2AAA8_9GAMM
MLVKPFGKRHQAPRTRSRASTKSMADLETIRQNKAAIERGYATHEAFELEANTYMMEHRNTRTISQDIVLALAIAAGLLSLLAAATT